MPFPFSDHDGRSPANTAKPCKQAGGDAHAQLFQHGRLPVAAKVFTEGLRRAGRSNTRDAVIAGLEAIQKVDFGGFNVDFGPKDHVASTYVDLSMLTSDGKVRR